MYSRNARKSPVGAGLFFASQLPGGRVANVAHLPVSDLEAFGDPLVTAGPRGQAKPDHLAHDGSATLRHVEGEHELHGSGSRVAIKRGRFQGRTNRQSLI